MTLRLADWFARAERARFAFLAGGGDILAWPDPKTPGRVGTGGASSRGWRAFTERATWAEIGYGLGRLPFSAVALTFSVAVWAAGLARGRPAGLRP